MNLKVLDLPSRPKRDAVLDAALGLFADCGFGGTAMPDLARAAGVGAGTIYRYFPSKEALANVLYRQCKAKLGETVWHGFDPEAPLRETFLGAWRRMAAFACARPREFRFLELHHHAPYLDDESRALAEQVEAPGIAFMRRGVETGAFPPLPPALAIGLVWGALVGLVKHAEAHATPLDAPAVELAGAMLWSALSAPASDAAGIARNPHTSRQETTR